MGKKKFCVIIPAAGRGIRLKPFTDETPKVLFEIAGKPILGHILEQVKKLNPCKIYIVTGYLGFKVRRYVKTNHPKLDVDFVKQKYPKGLGHAVMLGLRRIKTPVLIILGDTILVENLKNIIKTGQNIIAVKKVKNPQKYGIVETKGTCIVDMYEKPKKPKSNLAIVGAYFFSETKKLKKSLQDIAKSKHTTKGEMQLTDAIKNMVDNKTRITAYKIKNWYDCGTFEEILCANKYLLKTKHTGRMYGCKIKNPVLISPLAKIKNSHIGPHVYIAEKTNIQNCTIKDAIICKNTKLKKEVLGSVIIKGAYRKNTRNT